MYTRRKLWYTVGMDTLTKADRAMLTDAADAALTWVGKNMLTFDRGRWGVYERIRTDRRERVCLVRPDTASECIKALWYYQAVTGTTKYEDVRANVTEWLLGVQNTEAADGDTAFPFALIDGNRFWPMQRQLYQNDNGKILINLTDMYRKTGDKRLLAAAEASAAWWMRVQRADGSYYDAHTATPEKDSRAPCFLLWMMAGMYALFTATGREAYRDSARKAFSAVSGLLSGGRIRTAYETTGAEWWRPLSSEVFIALLCFALSDAAEPDGRLMAAADSLLPFALGLIDGDTGAVVNCTRDTRPASRSADPDGVDLVYTEGFALNALFELYRRKNDPVYLRHAVRLADFLRGIQLKGEGPCLDGGWRGTYNLRLKRYAGRCDNDLEEGGVHSVYTGWTAFPIVFGMLKIAGT